MLVDGDNVPEYTIELETEYLTAPIIEGQNVGNAKICFEDGTVKEVSLTANGDVPVRDRNFFKIIYRLFMAIFGLD